MSSAIINVRYEFGSLPRYIRVARAADINIHQAFQRDVILYHPRDLKPAGFYAIARLVDFCPDFDEPQFMYLAVTHIRPIPKPVSAREYLRSTQQKVDDGWIHRKFAPGFRLIAEADLHTIGRLAGIATEFDEAPGSAPFFGKEGLHQAPGDSLRTDEARAARDAKLRFEALDAYGPACAVSGVTTVAPDGIGQEVEVCHFWAFGSLGPDNVNNVMPMMRTVHWCFDQGWFGMRRDGLLSIAPGAPFVLQNLLKGRTRASFPARVELWPNPECLRWHWENRFLKALEIIGAPAQEF